MKEDFHFESSMTVEIAPTRHITRSHWGDISLTCSQALRAREISAFKSDFTDNIKRECLVRPEIDPANRLGHFTLR
jgi:hypothetical protein